MVTLEYVLRIHAVVGSYNLQDRQIHLTRVYNHGSPKSFGSDDRIFFIYKNCAKIFRLQETIDLCGDLSVAYSIFLFEKVFWFFFKTTLV